MRVTEGPFEWPMRDAAVHAALKSAYRDGSWGKYHGPNGDGLIEDLKQFFGVGNALLCSSGTIGVELALRGCGLEAGDHVVLAGYDFPGNFRAIEAIGARPMLVDVDPESWCLDVNLLDGASTDRVKAVVVSHLHGGLADVPALLRLARTRGWHVVEDACQQPGAMLEGRRVGTWGHVGVLSFGGSKLLTSGRGGAVLTDDAQILQRMKVFAERGNWAFPLSELQAAVLRPQLEKLEERNGRRRDSVDTILRLTSNLKQWLRPVAGREESQAAYYKLAWSLVPAESDPSIRDELVARLKMAGAPIDVGFRGFTRRSDRRCERVGSLEHSERLSQSTVLLHHPILLGNEKAAQQVSQVLDHEVRRLVS